IDPTISTSVWISDDLVAHERKKIARKQFECILHSACFVSFWYLFKVQNSQIQCSVLIEANAQVHPRPRCREAAAGTSECNLLLCDAGIGPSKTRHFSAKSLPCLLNSLF